MAPAAQITGFFLAIGTVLFTCLDAGLQGKAFITGDIERLEEGGEGGEALKSDELPYRVDWFHACFMLASCYIAMVFTGACDPLIMFCDFTCQLCVSASHTLHLSSEYGHCVVRRVPWPCRVGPAERPGPMDGRQRLVQQLGEDRLAVALCSCLYMDPDRRNGAAAVAEVLIVISSV